MESKKLYFKFGLNLFCYVDNSYTKMCNKFCRALNSEKFSSKLVTTGVILFPNRPISKTILSLNLWSKNSINPHFYSGTENSEIFGSRSIAWKLFQFLLVEPCILHISFYIINLCNKMYFSKWATMDRGKQLVCWLVIFFSA